MDPKYSQLIEAILDGETDDGVACATALVQSGTKPVEIFTECIQTTLNELGERFGRLEVFLPDLMLASDVVQAIQESLLPQILASGESVTAGRAVIGTAYGDLHDIGKNMVSLMMQVNGYQMKDLGVSVSSVDFVKAAEEINADLLLISGLMLPSLPYMKDTIDMIKAHPKLKDTCRVMVGGGPVTQEWATKANADGYSNDALEAVHKANELMHAAR